LKSGKCWGETWRVFAGAGVEVHRLAVLPWMRCSRHRHAHKFNLFHVESGRLRVHVEAPYGLTDVTELMAGESMTVPPGLWHWFESTELHAFALEVYWTELDAEDIERADHGGPVKANGG
jgi:mannose-6-phosphate isomerase-like protein (cupin superfamily)